VLNLECIGVGPRLATASREWCGTRVTAGDRRLRGALERAAEEPLQRFPLPIVTDTGAWLGAGVPAVTLLGLEADGGAPRHLHGPGDALAALDARGIDAARRLLHAWLAACDRGEARGASGSGDTPAR
jgi:hypothetical protein